MNLTIATLFIDHSRGLLDSQGVPFAVITGDSRHIRIKNPEPFEDGDQGQPLVIRQTSKTTCIAYSMEMIEDYIPVGV